MPKDLKAVVSETEFSTILTYATSHLKGKIFRDIHLDDDILKYKGNDNEQIEVNFINLVKNIFAMNRTSGMVKPRSTWISFTRTRIL
jgi:hypothetical protein